MKTVNHVGHFIPPLPISTVEPQYEREIGPQLDLTAYLSYSEHPPNFEVLRLISIILYLPYFLIFRLFLFTHFLSQVLLDSLKNEKSRKPTRKMREGKHEEKNK